MPCNYIAYIALAFVYEFISKLIETTELKSYVHKAHLILPTYLL